MPNDRRGDAASPRSSPPARRILCCRFPHLGVLAALRQHPELRGEPVVVGGRPVLRLPVLAASEAARAAGVRPGQPLRQAQQVCPTAVFVPLDVEAVEALRLAAVAALGEVVPAVEMGDDEAYCDLTGRHAQHRDEAAWAAAAARALTGALGGEAPAAGVGGSRFVAWMAARSAAPHHVRRVRPGEEAAFLAPLPLGLLPAGAAVVERLAAVGLDRIGQVAGLSPADLSRQFGPEGALVHRLARGEDDLPLTPWRAPRAVVERLLLDGPSGDREMLRLCARRLALGLGRRLGERGLVAGRLELRLEVEEGPGVEAARVLPLPAGGGEDLWAALLGLLAAVAPPAPVAAVRLTAGDLAIAGGRQADLWRRADAAADSVVAAVTRLQDRFGAGSVLRPRLAVDPGDLPERRFTWAPPVSVVTTPPTGARTGARPVARRPVAGVRP